LSNTNLTKNRLAQEWQNIPHATIRRCIVSMRRRWQACVKSRSEHTAYLTAISTFPWKLWNSIWTNIVLQRRCLKWIKKIAKKKLNSWKNIFTSLFLYNVDIVAFILFVKIYKNISVAKLVSVVYIQCIYLISRKLMFM
jgi:hypothetical protein